MPCGECLPTGGTDGLSQRRDELADLKGTVMNPTTEYLLTMFGFAEETLADLIGLDIALSVAPLQLDPFACR